MNDATLTPTCRTRGSRNLSWLILTIVLTGTPIDADTKYGRQVSYVAGTFREIQVGCKGKLDARNPKELLIICGGGRLEISTSAIVLSRIVDSQQDAEGLGLTDVTISRRKGQKLIYV